MKTKIEWATDVWNPVTGCTKVSQGCKHCYAERVAGRFWQNRPFSEVICHEERLEVPLRWKKPRRVFVNSMSDLFHEKVDFSFVLKVFSVMERAKDHTFIVLTKRAERMLDFFRDASRTMGLRDTLMPAPPNVGMVVSVEDQAAADKRIPLLLQIPASVHGVSCEPLLGPVELSPYWLPQIPRLGRHGVDYRPNIFPSTINWVICGGESGPGARPMHPDWARALRDQCQAARVPYFFKQWGEYHPEFEGSDFVATCAVCGCSDNDPCEGGCYWSAGPADDDAMRDRCNRCAGIRGHRWPDGSYSYRVGKKTAGRRLDGREWTEYPETRIG